MSLQPGDTRSVNATSNTAPPSQSDTTLPSEPSGQTASTPSTETVLAPHASWIQKHHRRAIESGLDPTHGTFHNLSLYKINPHPQIRPQVLHPDTTYPVDPMKTSLIPSQRDEIQAGIKRCMISEGYTSEEGSRDLLVRLKEFEKPTSDGYSKGSKEKVNFDEYGQCNLFSGAKIQQSFFIKSSVGSKASQECFGSGAEVEDDRYFMRVQIDPFFHVNKFTRYYSDIVYDRKHYKPFGNESYYGGLSENYLKAMLRNYKDSKPYIEKPGDVLCGMARSLWEISHMISDLHLPAEEERAMLEEYTDEHGQYGKGLLFGDVDGVKSRTVIIDNPSNHIYPKVAISYTNLQSFLTRQRELENFTKFPREDRDMRHDPRDAYQNPVNSKWCLSSTKEREEHRTAEMRDRQNRFENHTNLQNPLNSRWDTARPDHMITDWYIDDDPDRDLCDDEEVFIPIDRDWSRFYQHTYPEEDADNGRATTYEENSADTDYESDQEVYKGQHIFWYPFPEDDEELFDDPALGTDARAQLERVAEMTSARRAQRTAESRGGKAGSL